MDFEFDYIFALESFYDDQIVYIEGMNNIAIMESGAVPYSEEQAEAKKGLISRALGAISNFIETIRTKIREGWRWIQEKFGEITEKLNPFFERIKNSKIVSSIINSSVYKAIEGAVSTLKNRVNSFINSIGKKSEDQASSATESAFLEDSALDNTLDYPTLEKQTKVEKAKETTVKFVKDNADRAKEFYNKISKELDEHILAPLNKKIKELGNRMDNNSVGKYVMKGVRAICSAAQWIRTKAMNLSTGAYYSLHRVYRTARHKLGKDPKVKPQATAFRSQVDK